MANIGTGPAHNVTIGPTATTKEFETVARDPSIPVAVLEPKAIIAFTSVVKFHQTGRFELGVSAVADDAVALPVTRPISVDDTNESWSAVSQFWVPGILIAGVAITILAIRHWQAASLRRFLGNSALILIGSGITWAAMYLIFPTGVDAGERRWLIAALLGGAGAASGFFLISDSIASAKHSLLWPLRLFALGAGFSFLLAVIVIWLLPDGD